MTTSSASDPHRTSLLQTRSNPPRSSTGYRSRARYPRSSKWRSSALASPLRMEIDLYLPPTAQRPAGGKALTLGARRSNTRSSMVPTLSPGARFLVDTWPSGLVQHAQPSSHCPSFPRNDSRIPSNSGYRLIRMASLKLNAESPVSPVRWSISNAS